ncbi:MAG: acyloxyacyl hydrolase, partial [Planctomycetota bacterium]
ALRYPSAARAAHGAADDRSPHQHSTMGIDLIVRLMAPAATATSGARPRRTFFLSARLLVAVTVLVAASAGARGDEPSDFAPGFDEAALALTTHLSFDPPPPEPAPVEPLADAPEAAPDAADAAAAPLLGEFSKTTWVGNVYGSAIFGDSGKGEMYLAHIGFGYYFEDYNGGAIGLDVLYRNHFLRSEDDKRTIFVDGGLGLQQASTNFSGERHFNLRIMFGFGGSIQIDNNARLFGGCRYIHISDAGIKGGGGGFDGPMVYAGITFPF